jgi:hypothetical protein
MKRISDLKPKKAVPHKKKNQGTKPFSTNGSTKKSGGSILV